jgi:hypothetical protein
MYKTTPSKLPRWQRDSSPSYRRVPLTRRHRLLIILAISFLVWYRYLRPDSSDGPQDVTVYSNVGNVYPVERARPEPPVWQSSERKVQLAKAPLVERKVQLAKEPPVAPPKRSDPEQNQEPTERPLRVTPDIHERDYDDQAPVHPAVKQPSPEYAVEDIPYKQAVLDTRTKGDSGPSDLVQQEPTELVKQASGKLVEQHLTPAVIYDEVKAEKEEEANRLSTPKSRHKKFPPYTEYAALDEKGESLPDIVHVPFEDTTADVTLQGWEDQWFSDAVFDIGKWGKIPEPKIDFVYTCEPMPEPQS